MRQINLIKEYFWNKLIVKLIYKPKFSVLGEGFYVKGKPCIGGPGKLCAGKNLSLTSLGPIPIRIVTLEKNSIITFGDDVKLNRGVTIWAQSKIDIGASTIIGDGTWILDSDWHGLDGSGPKIIPIKIGTHVWIGYRAIILKGVTIGDNAVIGAGSVVTRNVEKNSIVAGNPAKQIGTTESGYTE